MLLSVIIPVYNGEKYIEDSVMSVLNQAYQNLEIIIINDGSIDRTHSICERLVKIDDRVKVINKTNGGVASARNLGISESKGKYIVFLDSDDIWDKNFYNEDLSLLLKQDYDMIGFGYSLANENMNRFKYNSVDERTIINCKDIDKVTINYGRHHSSYIIKKRIIEDNDITISGTYNEDEIFRNKCLYKSNKIAYVNKNIFYYRNNTQSVTHQKKNIKKVYSNIINNWIEAKEWFSNQNDRDILIQEHCNNIIASLVLEMIRLMCEEHICIDIEKSKNIKNEYKEYLPIIRKFSWDPKLIREYSLYKNNPKIYAISCYIKGCLKKIGKNICRRVSVIHNMREIFKYRSILNNN